MSDERIIAGPQASPRLEPPKGPAVPHLGEAAPESAHATLSRLARCLDRVDLEETLLSMLLEVVPEATALVSLESGGPVPSRAANAEGFQVWPDGRKVPPLLATTIEDEGEPQGWIGYIADEVPEARRETALARLLEIAEEAGIPAHNSRKHSAAIELAMRDPLTGLFNRRALDAFLDREEQWAQRYERPLSVILIDIDRFKEINDTFGHAMGDRVLRSVADEVQRTVRKSDLVARSGGDEFAVILPGTPATSAARLAQRIRRAISQRRIFVDKNQAKVPLTGSFGVADLRSGGGCAEEMLKMADAALYRAKRKGRNRVCRGNRVSPFSSTRSTTDDPETG